MGEPLRHHPLLGPRRAAIYAVPAAIGRFTALSTTLCWAAELRLPPRPPPTVFQRRLARAWRSLLPAARLNCSYLVPCFLCLSAAAWWIWIRPFAISRPPVGPPPPIAVDFPRPRPATFWWLGPLLPAASGRLPVGRCLQPASDILRRPLPATSAQLGHQRRLPTASGRLGRRFPADPAGRLRRRQPSSSSRMGRRLLAPSGRLGRRPGEVSARARPWSHQGLHRTITLGCGASPPSPTRRGSPA
mmetsp:Transcript_44541/g.93186  ORF Transcript_44541/g.93186 Transcript_44541/m.93186 type:complete len:245 (-) Transcript_44541:229-963(-)